MRENFEALAARYLSGEMPAEDRSRFEQFLADDPEAAAVFADYRAIWHALPPETPELWNEDQAWERFSHSLAPSRDKAIVSRRPVVRIAAAAVLLIVAGLAIFFPREKTVAYTWQDHQDTPVVLDDGSKVFLNTGASVSVSSFTGNTRRVGLTGEAFFEVTPDPERPFLVSCGKTLTEVTGTSFNVRQSGDDAAVYVSSGKVIFFLEKNTGQAIALTAGEAAKTRGNTVERVSNPTPNVTAWHTRKLQFSKMPLSQVIADINTYFGSLVVLDDETVAYCRITIPRPFTQPDIHTVVEAVAIAVNARLLTRGDTLVISGGNCR